MTRALRLVAAAVLVAAGATAQAAGPTESFLIVTSAGVVQLELEIADEPAERAQGLMFRRALAPRGGMLFDFGTTGPVTMWMKNTFIPLDMLFVDADGRIVAIARETVPESLDTISSRDPVRAVIEIAGGSAAALGIAEGDLVARPLFPN
jgi:uncharacterized membrane protein (UPF0127 family)